MTTILIGLEIKVLALTRILCFEGVQQYSFHYMKKKMFLGNWKLNFAFFFLQPFWYNLINQLVTHIQNLIYQSHGYFISFREYLTNTERSSNTFLLLEILWQIKNLSLKLPRALTPGQIKSVNYATFIKITIVYSWWACYNEGTVDT